MQPTNVIGISFGNTIAFILILKILQLQRILHFNDIRLHMMFLFFLFQKEIGVRFWNGQYSVPLLLFSIIDIKKT